MTVEGDYQMSYTLQSQLNKANGDIQMKVQTACQKAIDIKSNCQIYASSMLSSAYMPHNTLSKSAAWASGTPKSKGGVEYLLFEFPQTEKIFMVSFQTPDSHGPNKYEPVKEVTFEAGLSVSEMKSIRKLNDPSVYKFFEFSEPLTLKFAKFVFKSPAGGVAANQ